jgi:RHS repeat-associated protein
VALSTNSSKARLKTCGLTSFTPAVVLCACLMATTGYAATHSTAYFYGGSSQPLVKVSDDGSGTQLNLYLDGGGGLSIVKSQTSGAPTYYLSKNFRTDVSVIRDNGSNVLDGFVYDLEGTPQSLMASTTAATMPYRYGGHDYDATMGLYDYGFRFYGNGAFLSPDAFGDSISPYVAFGDNGVNYKDAHGGVRILAKAVVKAGFGLSREHSPYRVALLNKVIAETELNKGMLMVSVDAAIRNRVNSVVKVDSSLGHGAVIKRFAEEMKVSTWRDNHFLRRDGLASHDSTKAAWPKNYKQVMKQSIADETGVAFNLEFQNLEMTHYLLKYQPDLVRQFASGDMSNDEFLQMHQNYGVTNMEIAVSLIDEKVRSLSSYVVRTESDVDIAKHWGYEFGEASVVRQLSENEAESFGLVLHNDTGNGLSPVNNEDYISASRAMGLGKTVPPESSYNSVDYLKHYNDGVGFSNIRSDVWLDNRPVPEDGRYNTDGDPIGDTVRFE